MRWLAAAWTAEFSATLVVLLGQSSALQARQAKLRGWAVPATLEMRLADDGRILLHPGTPFVEPFAGAQGDPAYVLDPETLDVTVASEAMWNAATAPIYRCDAAGVTDPTRVRLEPNAVIHIGTRVLETHGRPRDMRLDPSGHLLAVLTARGITPPSWSPVPSLAKPDRLIGWRYHELFAFPSGRSVGQPVSLGFRTGDPLLCWAPTGTLVVYADPRVSEVNLVRVERSGGE